MTYATNQLSLNPNRLYLQITQIEITIIILRTLLLLINSFTNFHFISFLLYFEGIPRKHLPSHISHKYILINFINYLFTCMRI